MCCEDGSLHLYDYYLWSASKCLNYYDDLLHDVLVWAFLKYVLPQGGLCHSFPLIFEATLPYLVLIDST
jgi:hypothetical protein